MMPDELPDRNDINELLTKACYAMRDAGMDLPTAAALFMFTAWQLVAENMGEAAADRWVAEMGRRKLEAPTWGEGAVMQRNNNSLN